MFKSNDSRLTHEGSGHKHLCLFYSLKEDLLSLVIPFLREGIRNNQLCIWIIPEVFDIEEVEMSLAREIEDFKERAIKGQIRLIESRKWYLGSGGFDPDEILSRWGVVAKEALEFGFRGICACGELPYSAEVTLEKIIYYERKVDSLMQGADIKALCTYHVDRLELTEMSVLSMCHDSSFRKSDGKLDILTV